MKLTKSKVDLIPHPASGQVFHRDDELLGFGLRVGTATKTYFAESKVRGRTVRVTIGKHGVFTPEQARVQARRILGDMASGINPNDRKSEERAQGVTLGEAFRAFLEARKSLKPRTVYDYRRIMGMLEERQDGAKRDPRKAPLFFRDWKDRPLVAITRDMVARRHREIGAVSQAQANLAMRLLRAVFTFAAERYRDSKGQPLIADNPVRGLSAEKAWYRVERRRHVIKAHELPAFFTALDDLKSDAANGRADVVRDFILFLLFTGLRRGEAARLRWADVDLKARTVTLTDTKNREPHTLPLPDYLIELLGRRAAARENEYVFPGPGAGGWLVEPKKQKLKVVEASGVEFTLHDLRRTFITVAESLDIAAYALKRLLNHKMRGDVTAGYIVADVERLREPMEKIADYLLKAGGIRRSAPVLDLSKQRATVKNR